MRYSLGILDQYPFEIVGSSIENTPMYIVTFKQDINIVKLENSLYRAVRLNPLFGTKVGYDGNYFLEDNSKPIKVLECSIHERPLEFGRNSNDYPWQVCCKGRKMTFEWFHSITDGIGAFNFLKDVLCIYADMEIPIDRHVELRPGLEPFVDRKEKGINFRQGKRGFSNSLLPVYDWGFETRCFTLEASTEEILKVSKANRSIPSCILAVLMSKALRCFLPETAKNRDVACNVVINLRKSMNCDTQHNCKDFKRMTYTDDFDRMSFSEVTEQYRKDLDEIRLPENVVKIISDRYSMIRALHMIKSRFLRKKIMSVAGGFFKKTDCNFVLSYIGKEEYPKEITETVENIQFRTWTDFSNCILACVDYNGRFMLDISSNFTNQEIVEKFIELSRNAGINWKLSSVEQFRQASFIE